MLPSDENGYAGDGKLDPGEKNLVISIITLAHNAADTLENCIEIVRGQSFPVEHLIIHGGSTNSSLDILKQHSGVNLRYISEPDESMYDAINKGIRMTAGKVIGILKADDFYADEYVLKTVA